MIPFIVVEIDKNPKEFVMESIGTKEKFWFTHNDFGRCLFKVARPNTGDDWSEKIAVELCRLLNLPHAEYHLATHDGRRGIISRKLEGELVTGNQVLPREVKGYPGVKSIYHKRLHQTIDSIFSVIGKPEIELPFGWQPIPGATTARSVFIGYLLLDVWISNPDRHEENWGYVIIKDPTNKSIERKYLAPTYDHASGLGTIVLDEEKEKRLHTRDKGYMVKAYIEKCKSALYLKPTDATRLTTFGAYEQINKIYPAEAKVWLKQLEQISPSQTSDLLKCLPNNLISEISLEFAQEILKLNRARLLNLLNQ